MIRAPHSKTPVALFTYNRPAHAGRALASLARCHRFDDCQVYLFCDGSKGGHDQAAVEASRKVVRDWAAQHGAEVIERPDNLGLARSIVAGVTDLCARLGRVIVLEDDMQVSPDFLDYMIQALDRYESEAVVYQISAFMFPAALSNEADAYFLPLTTTRGWATWERAWRIFDWQATGARERLADPEIRKRFDLDGNYPYSNMLEDRLAGKNDSWGILWWWAVFQTGGLVLHPRTSLVWMDGFDGTGTHCGVGEIEQVSLELMSRLRLSTPIRFPGRIGMNQEVLEAIKAYLAGERSMRSGVAREWFVYRLLKPFAWLGRRRVGGGP